MTARSSPRAACPRARAAATPCATSPATRWAGVCEDEVFDPTPYVGAYVRYFVRHPTTQLMPRKVKTAFTGTDEDRAITGIHDIAFLAARARRRPRLRGARRRRHVDHAAHRPDALRLRRGRQRRLPEGRRGRLPHLRPPGLAARQPRPRPHQGARRQGRHRRGPQAWSTRSSRATGSTSATSTSTRMLFVHDEEANAPAAARVLRQPERRPLGVRALLPQPTSQPQRQEGFSDRPGQGHARRPDARAVPRPRRRSCATTRGGYARTTVHQNLVLRWVRDEAVYDVWQRLARARPRRRRRRRDHRRRQLPRHRQLQARHHQLDGPQRRGPASASRRWRSTTRSRSRIHIKMSGCPNGCCAAPHREHRVLRRLDQGRRAHDPGLRRAHRRQLRGRRGRLRHAPEGPPAGQARARTRSSAGSGCTRPSAQEGEAFNAFAERVGTKRVRGRGPRPRAARSSSASRR